MKSDVLKENAGLTNGKDQWSLQTLKGRVTMTDISQDSSANGAMSSTANGQDTSTNGSGIQDPDAVVAKNKELLALLRKEKDQAKALQARMQEIEQQKLQAEGKKDELIAQLQAEMKNVKSEYAKTKTKYAFNAVKKQTELKAKDFGCVDTETLVKVMDLESLQVEVVDDDFNVNEQSLMASLESVRKTKPYLFKQAGPKINDGVPSSGQPQSSGKVDFSKMTKAEILEYAKKNNIS